MRVRGAGLVLRMHQVFFLGGAMLSPTKRLQPRCMGLFDHKQLFASLMVASIDESRLDYRIVLNPIIEARLSRESSPARSLTTAWPSPRSLV